jgi:hypothetical protein
VRSEQRSAGLLGDACPLHGFEHIALTPPSPGGRGSLGRCAVGDLAHGLAVLAGGDAGDFFEGAVETAQGIEAGVVSDVHDSLGAGDELPLRVGDAVACNQRVERGAERLAE